MGHGSSKSFQDIQFATKTIFKSQLQLQGNHSYSKMSLKKHILSTQSQLATYQPSTKAAPSIPIGNQLSQPTPQKADAILKISPSVPQVVTATIIGGIAIPGSTFDAFAAPQLTRILSLANGRWLLVHVFVGFSFDFGTRRPVVVLVLVLGIGMDLVDAGFGFISGARGPNGGRRWGAHKMDGDWGLHNV